MDDQILIRIDPALKEQLVRVAKMEGKTSSEVVRSLIEEYLKQRDIGSSALKVFADPFPERIDIARRKRHDRSDQGCSQGTRSTCG